MSMRPLIKPFLESGNTILKKRVKKFAPAICPASSSSVLIWSILDVPAREAKGKCFTIETRTSTAKVPYSDGMSVSGCPKNETRVGDANMARYIASVDRKSVV